MSRRLLLLCVTCVLVLTACHKTQAAEPLAVDFSCDFTAQYENLTASGRLTRHTAGTLLLEFTAPETLDGVAAEWDGEKVWLRYRGLSFSTDNIPESALGEELIRAFDTALRGEGERETKDGVVTLAGTADGTAFTYCYRADNGQPLTLSVPALPLTVTFSNVQ